MSPLPRTPIYKGTYQHHVPAGGQSQRAQNRRDRQTDRQRRKFRLPAAMQTARGCCAVAAIRCPPSLRSLVHKGTFQHHVTACGQSERAQNWTDRQTDRYTHKTPPPDPFYFYSMETSNVAASPRTVNSGLVNKLVFRVNQTARENSGGPRQFRLPVVVVQWRQSVVPHPP